MPGPQRSRGYEPQYPPAQRQISLLKNELTRKVGIRNKRLAAALDDTYLEKVLTGT